MSEQDETDTRHSHVERVSRELEGWLACRDWTLEEVHDWLQGHRLPPVGHDEDAFVWILRGLLCADERGAAEAEMARRLARVLDEQPDVTRPGLRPDEMLYNLFMLCAGLGLPEVLGEPLLAVYGRRALSGKWMGTDLRVALTAALIPNQVNKALLPVWQSMVDGGGHDFLIGSLAHGLDGVTFLPGVEPDEPPLREIGEALKALSLRLQDETDRRPEFAHHVERVVSRYPGRPSRHAELLRLADRYDWPDWALISLPSLCVWLEDVPGGRRILLWEVYLPLVSMLSFQAEDVRGLCRDKVFSLTLTEEAADYLAPFIAELEERRRPGITPLPTYSAVVGAVTDLMSEIEQRLLSKVQSWSQTDYPEAEAVHAHAGDLGSTAVALAQARRVILTKNRAGAVAPSLTR